MLRTFLLVSALGCGFPPWALAAKEAPANAPAERVAAQPAAREETAPPAAPNEKAQGGPPARVTGTFSNLRGFGDDGDLVGVEVTIVGSRDGLLAIVQTADGVAAAPVIVPVDADGPEVAFPIPGTTGKPMEFKGRVTRQALTGTLDGRAFTLPRRKSYWQQP
jgi:hypothetical protein